MQVAERHRTDEVIRLLELAVGFAGKSDHDICTEGKRLACSSEELVHLLCVVPGTITTVHATQNRVRTRLEREVRMSRQTLAAVFRHECDERCIPIHWLYRTQA